MKELLFRSLLLKLALGLLAFLVVVMLYNLVPNASQSLRGVSFQNPQYNTSAITTSTVSCGILGETLVLAADAGRTSFVAQNATTNGSVALCKGTNCVVGGIRLIPNGTTTTGTSWFEQNDGYIGAYSCRSIAHTTGTLDVVRSN